MPIRPPAHRDAWRGRRPARAIPVEETPAKEVETPARIRRPIPERTGPIRTAAGLFREDPPEPSAGPGKRPPAPAAPETPAEEAVAIAYQVFDRYLEEGRRYAEGYSAWHPEEGARRGLLRDAVRGGADLLGLVERVAREIGRAAPLASLDEDDEDDEDDDERAPRSDEAWDEVEWGANESKSEVPPA